VDVLQSGLPGRTPQYVPKENIFWRGWQQKLCKSFCDLDRELSDAPRMCMLLMADGIRCRTDHMITCRSGTRNGKAGKLTVRKIIYQLMILPVEC
jgi:hypothetical protein